MVSTVTISCLFVFKCFRYRIVLIQVLRQAAQHWLCAHERKHMLSVNCFVFHDVDFVAESDYPLIMVKSLKKQQFIDINGYSNSYWGWGAENDDRTINTINTFIQS